jgi:F0F1-type ATP synthase epsilon subunit
MLAVTRAGVVTLHLEGGDKKRLVVGPGFAEVGPDRVTLLVDSCEVAEDIDKAAAQKVLELAERTLLDTEPDSGPWLDAHKQIELSRARIEA